MIATVLILWLVPAFLLITYSLPYLSVKQAYGYAVWPLVLIFLALSGLFNGNGKY